MTAAQVLALDALYAAGLLYLWAVVRLAAARRRARELDRLDALGNRLATERRP